jgi:hypothetical protein
MLNKSILSYRGPLSFGTIDWLLSQFKIAAQDHDLPFKTYKKMLCIMIEALENIIKYSDQVQCNGEVQNEFCPSCQINRNTKSIELVTMNPVKNEEVDPLRKKIDNVNNHNKEELKELYRTTISNGEFTPKGGAGLGFIEMAKTAGNKLEYRFENLTKDYTLYTFRVRLSI